METRRGTLLVQTLSSQQSQNILKITQLANTPVTVILNDHMNKRKGIINYDNLPGYSNQQIVEALEEFKVTEVYQIKKRNNNNNTTETTLYILTFNSLKLPENVQIGWTNCRVRPYIPRPRRCFKCHRYGHGALNCRSPVAICGNCGSGSHGECNLSPKCINCSGDHPVFSTECQTYRYEEEIIATQIRENITFKEAKTVVAQRYVRPRRTFSEIVQQQPQTAETNDLATLQQPREPAPIITLPIEKSPPVIVTSYSNSALPRDFHRNPTAFTNTRNRFACLTETESTQNIEETSEIGRNIELSQLNPKKRPKEISPEHTTMKKSCHDSKQAAHSTATTEISTIETTENEMEMIPPPPPPIPTNNKPTDRQRSRSRDKKSHQSQRTHHNEKPKSTGFPVERRSSENSSFTLERNMRIVKPLPERRSSSSSTDTIRFKIPFRKTNEQWQKPK